MFNILKEEIKEGKRIALIEEIDIEGSKQIFSFSIPEKEDMLETLEKLTNEIEEKLKEE